MGTYNFRYRIVIGREHWSSTNTMNENCESFDRRADSICRNAAKKTNNLTDALQACEGLFPTLAVPQFAKIDRERTEHWLREAAEKLKISQFVNEHSASYVLSTWDFCSEQIEAMGSVAWHSESRICLLGTPSLVQYLPDATAIPPHVLIDLRAPSTEMSRNIIHPCLSGCNPHPLYVGCAVIRQARVSEWKLMF